MADNDPAHYLLFDAQGAPTGGGFTPDGTLPVGAVTCTADQATTPQAWRLQDGQLAAAADTAASLIIYANAKQWALLLGGYLATVDGGQHRFACDGQAAGFMASTVMDLTLPDPPTGPVDWQLMDGSFVSVAPADFIALARRIRTFGQATFTVLKTGLGQILAGTLTTRGQVDELPWPVNHD